MVRLDSRFGSARSLVHPACDHGRINVCANQTQSDTTGSDSSQSNDVYADRVFGDVFLFSFGLSAVLGRQQSSVDRPTMGDHSKSRKDKINFLTLRKVRSSDFQSPPPLAADFFVYR